MLQNERRDRAPGQWMLSREAVPDLSTQTLPPVARPQAPPLSRSWSAEPAWEAPEQEKQVSRTKIPIASFRTLLMQAAGM